MWCGAKGTNSDFNQRGCESKKDKFWILSQQEGWERGGSFPIFIGGYVVGYETGVTARTSK